MSNRIAKKLFTWGDVWPDQNTNSRMQVWLEILFNFFIIMNEIMVVQPFDHILARILHLQRFLSQPFWQVCYLVIPLVAFRINWAISFGWDTSEAWLEGSEIVAAFICFANICSWVVGVAWSFSDTWYHVGVASKPQGQIFRLLCLIDYLVSAQQHVSLNSINILS
jgi:hypothetical protein